METLKQFNKLTKDYKKWIEEETSKTQEEFTVSSVGKLNPVTHLMGHIEETLNSNVMECLTGMVNTVVF